ncbi:unnamed protein product [Dovyalis caffra]|uniref:Glucose-methanol-choline oxidoreductase N-terminal domain-containing protein n=1 Tax=Dovyalis caffra TaxID=77055 RepID=A0AAV1QWK9_9ROSI|nr:unnamed protein product [Dovyalis caffra]
MAIFLVYTPKDTVDAAKISFSKLGGKDNRCGACLKRPAIHDFRRHRSLRQVIRLHCCGGGTAGCPLAATLSERFSVLLVERGGLPYGNVFITNKGVPNHRGRVLGGSSAINFGFYSRASDDFVTRAGWNKKLVKEAYEWVESRIVSIPNKLTKFQCALKLGLLEAGVLPYNGFSWEHIEGTKIGGSLFDNCGERHTAADLLQSGNPDNIMVLLNATAKSKGNESIVNGIRFIESGGSPNQTYEAYLKHPTNSGKQGDVILSAGTLGSPQILMLSGIGPKSHLKNFGIPLVLDLEGVGQEMQDNPAIVTSATTRYQFSNTLQVAGVAEDFRFLYEGIIVPTSFNASAIVIAGKIAVPESRGKLELNNTDPRQNPLVEFNYLESEKDLEECVEMVRLLEKIARSKPITCFMSTQPQFNFYSGPRDLGNFCIENARTIYHYHGGCAVGSVVDKDYKVYGIKGLRIIDSSAFLESPGTNPAATVLMLGRYQGIKILEERESASALGTQPYP